MNEFAKPAAVGLLSLSWLTNDISVPFIGVKVTVVMMSVIGVLAAFAVTDKAESRKQLFGYIFCFSVVGCLFAALGPHWFNLEWVTDELKAPLAGAVSFLGKVFGTPIIKRVTEMIATSKIEFKFLKGKDQ